MILKVKVGGLKAGAGISSSLGAAGLAVATAIKEINAYTSSKFPSGIKVCIKVTAENGKMRLEELPLTDSAYLKINPSQDALLARAKVTARTPGQVQKRIKILRGVKRSL